MDHIKPFEFVSVELEIVEGQELKLQEFESVPVKKEIEEEVENSQMDSDSTVTAQHADSIRSIQADVSHAVIHGHEADMHINCGSEDYHCKQTCVCACGEVFPNTASLKEHIPTCHDYCNVIPKSECHCDKMSEKCYFCNTYLLQSSSFEKQKSGKMNNKQTIPKAVKSPVHPSHSSNEKQIRKATIWKCEMCSKVFSCKAGLTTHKYIHSDDKQYKCEFCGKSFYKSSGLIAHRRTHTGEKPYECDVCKKMFSLMSTLRSHLRVHTGEKPFKCEICGKTFNHRSSIGKHQSIHSEKKRHTCEICGDSFSQATLLQYHKRVHTGEKVYKCEICGKAYYFPSSLNSHKRVHTGEKPYKCNICGISFAASGHFKKHIQRHSGKKPFVCGICGKSFSDSLGLKTHQCAKSTK